MIFIYLKGNNIKQAYINRDQMSCRPNDKNKLNVYYLVTLYSKASYNEDCADDDLNTNGFCDPMGKPNKKGEMQLNYTESVKIIFLILSEYF